MAGIPNILIIDDFFGREVPGSARLDRASLCRRLGLIQAGLNQGPHSAPTNGALGLAHFHRGQNPVQAKIGDFVKNDIEGVLKTLIDKDITSKKPWSLILLDLCFRTGRVTAASNREFPGVAEGRPEDDLPAHLFGIDVLRAIQVQKVDIPVVVFSGLDAERLKACVMEFPSVLGCLPRDAPDTRERLASFLIRVTGEMTDSPIPGGIEQLLSDARALSINDDVDLGEFMGHWRETQALVFRCLLSAALNRAGKIRGEPALRPAVRLLDKTSGATTVKSADFFKRVVREVQPHENIILADPLVAKAYAKALRLRGIQTRPLKERR